MLDGLGIERVRLHDARHSRATLMHLRQVTAGVAWARRAAFTLSVYADSQGRCPEVGSEQFWSSCDIL
jgi:hypothetical protein